MQVQAAVVRDKGTFTLETVDLDAPRPDEVLVKLAAVGICHTDLVFRDQHVPLPLPAVLGHEGRALWSKSAPL